MRILLLLISMLVLVSTARAESYQDKKDREAIATITRNLDGLARDPKLFDGAHIPADANLADVERYFDQMTKQLKIVVGALNDLSGAAAAKPDAQKLRAKFDELARYRDSLAPVLRDAKRAGAASARDQLAADDAASAAAYKKCTGFHDEVERGADRVVLHNLVGLADGGPVFWQTVEEGAKYIGALERIATTCARPEFADVGKACVRPKSTPPPEAVYCTLPAKKAEILRRGVENLIANYVKTLGPKQLLAHFASDLGWLQVEGVPSFGAYFSGKQLQDQLKKRIAPLLVQAGMAPTDADALFGKLATEYSALEAKARELAPTWDLPGAACSGAGCGPARTFITKWYGTAPRRFLQTQAGWKIVTNDAGVITYREKYGYAMFQVKGDPFCQLREWTLSEQHAGGGRYTPASDVTLGPVRWQTCK